MPADWPFDAGCWVVVVLVGAGAEEAAVLLLSSPPVRTPTGHTRTMKRMSRSAPRPPRSHRRVAAGAAGEPGAVGKGGTPGARSAGALARLPWGGRGGAAAALALRNHRNRAVLVQLLERVEQGPRPAAGGLRAPQVALRGGGLRAGLLAEDVVGELPAPVLLDPARRHRGELHERVARQLAHPPLGQVQHVRQLGVRLPLTKHELDDRPLLGRE